MHALSTQTNHLLTQDDHLLEMERIVLAAILESNRYEEMASVLKPVDFLHPAHGLFFELCAQLHQQNLPIRANLILSKLSKDKDKESLLQVMASAPIAYLEPYVEAIKQASTRRALLDISMEVREQCLAERPSPQILDMLERALYALSMQNVRGGFKNSSEVVLHTLKLIEDAKLRGNSQMLGLDTGFYELNKYTAGFQNGDLIVVGARPSMGKTSFVLNIAQTTLNHNKGVAFFSMEMGAEQLMLRLLAGATSIHLHDLKLGKLQDYQWDELSQCAQDLQSKPLFIDDTSVLTLEHVRSKLRQIKAHHPEIGIAILDYLQLMSSNHSELARHAQIAEISRGLKVLARELEIPIIALSQLNRSLENREDKRPILSDLKESGAIEQDADQVLFLYRDEVYKKRAQNDLLAKLRKEGKDEEVKKLEAQFNAQKKEDFHQNHGVEDAEIILAKNRNGDIGTIKVAFNKAYTRFEDRSEKEREEKETAFSAPSAQSTLNVPNIF
ncbi:replicative DNA helicase [Helicobacter baculiformis]|uniref:Replicative DNA helicase n=1 Tax=Helicobacter baculiformis TaxID=427351 RepID=A0ABV7ZHP1_9HELI|nr:replicative DNA helicase [Helicobacter baculiformis]